MSDIKAFQKAARDSGYRCMRCSHILQVREGQMVPPCPKCGFREFQQTDEVASC